MHGLRLRLRLREAVDAGELKRRAAAGTSGVGKQLLPSHRPGGRRAVQQARGARICIKMGRALRSMQFQSQSTPQARAAEQILNKDHPKLTRSLRAVVRQYEVPVRRWCTALSALPASTLPPHTLE